MFTSDSVLPVPVEIFESLFTATDDIRNNLHESPIRVKEIYGPVLVKVLGH